MKRLAVFGGTFDPVHVGHLVPAIRAQEAFDFDRLLFVPSGSPPHKQGEPMTAFAHRFAMLVLATRPYERLRVSDVELGRAGPTYTVDTLKELGATCAAEHLYFIMGSDSFAQIATWHRWEELVNLAQLVVLHRAGSWGEALRRAVPETLRSRMCSVPTSTRVGDPQPGGPSIYLLEHEPLPVSATHLRERLRIGASVGELIPDEVRRYIVEYRLYLQEEEECHGS